jgi:hypothetical protein
MTAARWRGGQRLQRTEARSIPDLVPHLRARRGADQAFEQGVWVGFQPQQLAEPQAIGMSTIGWCAHLGSGRNSSWPVVRLPSANDRANEVGRPGRPGLPLWHWTRGGQSWRARQ